MTTILRLFSLLEKEYYPRRPLPLGFEQDTIYGAGNAVWYLDGRTYPKLVGQGGFRFATPTIMEQARRKSASIPAQELTDVQDRLKDFDRAGIQKQVVYPTMFLATITTLLSRMVRKQVPVHHSRADRAYPHSLK